MFHRSVIRARTFEVLLANDGGIPKQNPARTVVHPADWVGRISGYPTPPGFAEMADPLIEWASHSRREPERLERFIKELVAGTVGVTPDATALQADLERGGSAASELADRLRSLVERHFSEADGTVRVEFRSGSFEELPVIALAGIFATGVLCEEINRADAWTRDGTAAVRAGGYMAVAYLWMRLLGANPQQARLCVRADARS